MKIIENTKDKIVFALETSESLANALRRSALEIPILAIDEVEFLKNDSVLFDEVLALRLGLLVLKTPSDMEFQEECKCKGKGCSKCQAELKLSVVGPMSVNAKELKGKVEVVYEDTPIDELIDKQELSFVARAKLGKGIEHTKFTPGLLYYSYTPIIEKIKKEDIDRMKIIKLGEKDFNEVKEAKTKLVYDFMNEVVECNNEYVYVKPNTEEIIFTIESWGHLSPKEILLQSVDVIKKNLKEVSKNL